MLESIVRDHIMQHFKANKLFSDSQYKFIKGRSTTTQVLKILNEWTEYLGGGQITQILQMRLISCHTNG